MRNNNGNSLKKTKYMRFVYTHLGKTTKKNYDGISSLEFVYKVIECDK